MDKLYTMYAMIISFPWCHSYDDNGIASDLGGNDFHGTLPLCIASMANLSTLSLYNNRFTGELPSVANMTNLTNMSASFISLCVVVALIVLAPSAEMFPITT